MNKIYTGISHKKLTYTSKIVQLTTPSPPTQAKERLKGGGKAVTLICFAWEE